MHPIFYSIDKFRKWADLQERKYLLWECDFPKWEEIHSLFGVYLTDTSFFDWTEAEVTELLYILARDNDSQAIIRMIAEDDALLLFLAEQALTYGEPDAKWQLAVHLPSCANTAAAERMLVKYLRDEDEYVTRRALMALAQTGSALTEAYCKIAWESAGEMQEYQRIAVLHALFSAHSDLLADYIALAKKDGRMWLVQNALELESRMLGKEL